MSSAQRTYEVVKPWQIVNFLLLIQISRCEACANTNIWRSFHKGGYICGYNKELDHHSRGWRWISWALCGQPPGGIINKTLLSSNTKPHRTYLITINLFDKLCTYSLQLGCNYERFWVLNILFFIILIIYLLLWQARFNVRVWLTHLICKDWTG